MKVVHPQGESLNISLFASRKAALVSERGKLWEGSCKNKSKAMNIEEILQGPPRYKDIVTAYGLDVRGGDLQLTPGGNIAVTVDGQDLKWGNDRINAMHRLIQRWCFNAPTLAGLFQLVTRAHAAKQQLGDEMNLIASIAFQNTQAMQRFHDINNEVGASTFGGAACAGAIMVVLHNLLMRYKVDLNATKEKWEKSSPRIGGRSLGSIIAAGAANFRHHDEWARFNPPSEQQLQSIDVIAAALNQPIAPNGQGHPFRGNVCPQLLEALSDGNFDQLGQSFFAFAKDLAS
jgi:hypothetical protein